MEQQSAVKSQKIEQGFQEVTVRECFRKEGMGTHVGNATGMLSKANSEYFYLLETRNSLVSASHLN